MIVTLKAVADELQAKGFTFQALEVEEPGEIVADGNKRCDPLLADPHQRALRADCDG